MMRCLQLLLVAVLASFPAAASAARTQGLTIDLQHFFPSAEAELASRHEIATRLQVLESYQDRLGDDAGTLLAALNLYQDVQKLYYRHGLYLQLRCSLDRKDAACDDGDRMDADFAAHTAFLTSELQALSQSRLETFFASDLRLTPYRYYVEVTRRADPVAAAPGARQTIASLQPQISGWQYPLYQQILDDIPFGRVRAGDGRDYDVRRDRTEVLAGADEALRRDISEAYWRGLETKRDAFAFALIKVASADNAVAKIRGFANGPDASYHDRLLDPTAVRELLSRLTAKGELLRRYRTIRSAGPEPWNVSVVPADAPDYRLEEIRPIYRSAFRALGPAFGAAFDSLLDPAQRRADIATQAIERRAGAGFSLGFPGTPAVLFVGRFNGTFKDLSVIAHEGTHAAQRTLINEHRVPPVYATGPNYLMEATAAFSELVLADHMYRTARPPQLKRYYLERFLEIKGLSFLYGAQDAALEQAIHDGVEAGTIRTADDLDKTYFEIDSHYANFTAEYPAMKINWANRALAYQDPLYYVNYAYAGLIALEMFRQYRKDSAGFGKRYLAFLQRGFDAPPEALLQDLFGAKLSPEALVDDAASTVDETLGRLASLPAAPR